MASRDSQPAAVVDRISGQILRDGTELVGRHPLGRYAAVPGTAAVVLDGRMMQPDEYLAGVGRWRLQIGDHTATVVAENGDDPMPDPALVAAVHNIGGQVAEHLAAGRPLDELVMVSPVINQDEVKRRLEQQGLESALERHGGHLTSVCFRPAVRLRPVNRLLPVSRSTRISPATVVRLAARSEDWARLSPDGVKPERVLTPQREFNVDLYENRVAARLVDHVWDYLTSRIGEFETLTGTFADAQRYVDVKDAASRPFHAARSLWPILSDLLKNVDWSAQVAQRLHELRQSRNEVGRLRNTPLWHGVDHRAEVGMALRSTNLLTDEHRYRHVGYLWREWLATQGGTSGVIAQFDAVQNWCRMFEHYVALLLLRAFADAGFSPVDPTATPARGAGPTSYRAGAVPVDLRWSADGVFSVVRAGIDILRIVPLPHALTRSRHPALVAAELTGARGTAADPPTLVVYPAERTEREALPLALRLRAFETPGAPALHREKTDPYLVPASPLDVDSVVRLARALRWAVEAPRLDQYPLRVACHPAEAAVLGRQPWLRPEPHALALLQPPDEDALSALHDKLRALRQDTDRARQRSSNTAHVERLRQELDAAADRTVDLLRCPACGKQQRPSKSTWLTRNDGYRISCDNCSSSWENRRCRRCQETYPALIPYGAEPEPDGEPIDGDSLDRQVGSFLLAAPCWIRARVFICPNCATCGQAVKGNTSGCARCSPPDKHA